VSIHISGPSRAAIIEKELDWFAAMFSAEIIAAQDLYGYKTVELHWGLLHWLD